MSTAPVPGTGGGGGSGAAGVDGPWLEKWWLHVHEAASGAAAARWPLA
jgi:hypothetical protein